MTSDQLSEKQRSSLDIVWRIADELGLQLVRTAAVIKQDSQTTDLIIDCRCEAGCNYFWVVPVNKPAVDAERFIRIQAKLQERQFARVLRV